MTEKNKCRFCGVEAGKYSVSYPCGSWHTSNGLWSQGVACQDLCEQLRLQHEQTIDILRQQIDTAMKALEGITRCEIYPDDYYCVISERNEHGEWVQWDDVEDVIEILQGNSPTISEGSRGSDEKADSANSSKNSISSEG